MKRLLPLLIAICLAAPLTGCYHNQIIVQKNYNASATEPDHHSGFQMYLLMGLIPLGDNPVDLAQICPQGAGIVEVQQTFVNGLLSSIIGAILSFQDTKVFCARADSPAALETEGTPVAMTD